MSNERISQLVEEKREYYTGISRQIWENPEQGYQEFKFSEILIEALRENGFEVETGLAGIPTAFQGTYGSGKPVIGFLGEYDALAGLSQKAGQTEHHPLVEGGSGHGCGHNALGTCALAAAVTVKRMLEESHLSGTVIFYGCPAEEQGCGKSFMTRAGIFDDTDIALAPHPMDYNMIIGKSMLANIQAEFSFTGTAAHAANAPDRGRSALGAADLMIVGTQFLREHIIQEARLHHAYLDAGGSSPNVVQASARLLFFIRAPRAQQAKDIFERVKDVARGAALMTGTSVDIAVKSAMVDLLPNDVVGRLMARSWEELGPCPYSQKALEVAARMAPTVGNFSKEELLDTHVPGYERSPVAIAGSSDVGDVSYKVPTIMMFYTGTAKGTPPHSWQMTAQSATALMDDGTMHAAKVLASTAMKLYREPELVAEAQEELVRRTGGCYECLMPDDVRPEI
ncbi:MAG: amidohydrolase [Oscillibacter sp.]|jgi:aminobenzoyl-glutamate utilization protein B|nr:amidohydrolase [Oscillibacter sp.]MCI9002025.1 amidohydrolase [Oscillibacter sp.]